MAGLRDVMAEVCVQCGEPLALHKSAHVPKVSSCLSAHTSSYLPTTFLPDPLDAATMKTFTFLASLFVAGFVFAAPIPKAPASSSMRLFLGGLTHPHIALVKGSPPKGSPPKSHDVLDSLVDAFNFKHLHIKLGKGRES
jgi:hypothetical protein